VRETDDERRSRLSALAGRRGPLPLPGQGGPEAANAREVALNRGENLIASSGVSLGGYAASGLGATAASGRALTGWSTGTGDAGLLNTVSGATRAVGGLGAISGLAGTGGALLEAGAGLQSATDSTRSGTERGLGGMQAASGVSDAVKQSATASFNIASLTGNAAAAAAATLVAGGAGVVMGVIDMIRGAVQSYNARQREKMLRAVAFALESDLTSAIPASQKQTLLRTAADVARLQGLQWWGGAATMAKGALTIAGGAVLLAAGISNPVGWALLGGAAVLGAIYVFYKLREKRKYKRQVAVRELGIKSWRDRWKAEKKKIEAETTWGSQERRQRLRGLGDDPLDITLRSQGYESPGHFYARYITMTAEALHRNVVLRDKPDPQNPQPGDDLRRRSIELLESMGLRIDFTKPAESRTPSARRIAQALDP
jgi:hypothetical protein